MADHTESRITLHSHSRRARILAGDTLIADSCNAIELCERDYSSRQYPSCANADMSTLSVPATETNCPFKGDAAYYSQPDIADVTCSNQRPIDKLQKFSGHLSFGACKVS